MAGMSYLEVQQQYDLEVTPYLSEDLKKNWQLMWQTRVVNTEKNYVETAAYHEARKRLWYTGWVTLCGNLGDGRTCMAEHLVCNFVRGPWKYPEDPNFSPNQTRVNVERIKYRKVAIDEENRECYTPVFVDSPEDYRRKVDHSEHQIVVIDDIFGHAAYDGSLMEGWRPMLEDMLWNITAASPKTLVIVCVNKAHLDLAPGEITQMEWFRQCGMVDLSDEFKVLDSERMDLLNSSRVHLLPKEEMERCGHEKVTQSVGLVYRMYNQVRSFSMEGPQYFKRPWRFCTTAIDGVNDFDKTLYYTLCVAVLLDGRLDLSKNRLQDYDLRTLKVMEQLVPILAVPEHVDLAKMRFAARLLTGFFFNPVEKWVFEFTHPKIYFLCAQSLCKKDMKKVIELSSRRFMMNHVRALENNQSRESELVINCEPKLYAALAQRLTSEILCGHLRSTLQNESFENKAFVKVWFKLLKEWGTLDTMVRRKDETLNRSLLYWACYYGNGLLVKNIVDVAGELNLRGEASFKQELVWGLQAACGVSARWAGLAVRTLATQGVYVNLAENHQGAHVTDVFGREMVMLMRLEAAPIHVAALRGHPDVVQILIDEGANMNETTPDGYTPVHRAAMRRDRHAEDVVKVFIKNKAELTVQGRDERLPIENAVLCGNSAVAEALHHAGATFPKEIRKRLLSHAVQNRNYRLVEFMMQNKGDRYWGYCEAQNPLSQAVYNRDMRMIRLLLDNEEKIDDAADNNWPALCTACFYGELEIVKYLIEKGASVNTMGVDKNSPLHFAATAGWYDICELLISKGATTQNLNSFNETPLVLAARNKHQMVVWLLLREGMILDQP